jgi:hypothetical protein
MADETKIESSDAAEAGKVGVSKPLLAHKLPSNRLSLETIFQVLRAYAAASQDGSKLVSAPEAAHLAKVHESTPSLINAFFVDAGLLTKEGKKYRASRELLDYQNAYHFDSSNAAKKLQPAIHRSWIWAALRPRLAMGPVSREEAVTVLAEASRATKEDRPRLEVLVEFVSACGLLAPVGAGRMPATSTSDTTPVCSDPAKPPVNPASGNDTPDGSWIAMLLKKFPDFDPEWSEELKVKWFSAFDDLMKRGSQK